MGNPPAYQYYPSDFDEDTASWEVDEVGIYQRLLNYEWINGWKLGEGLPDDPERLARIARCTDKKFQKGWQIVSKKFSRNGEGFLINRRLEAEREVQREYREHQSQAGLLSVAVKRKKGIFPFNKSNNPSNAVSSAVTNDPANQNQTLQSSSSLKDLNKKAEYKDPRACEEQETCQAITRVIDYSQLQTKTDPLCKTLTGYFKDFNFYAWRQSQINKRKHPEAIEECLSLLWENRKTAKKVRPYLTQLMKIKGPNAFERIAMKTHEERKKEELEYDGHISGIFGRK